MYFANRFIKWATRWAQKYNWRINPIYSLSLSVSRPILSLVAVLSASYWYSAKCVHLNDTVHVYPRGSRTYHTELAAIHAHVSTLEVSLRPHLSHCGGKQATPPRYRMCDLLLSRNSSKQSSQLACCCYSPEACLRFLFSRFVMCLGLQELMNWNKIVAQNTHRSW